MLLLLCCLAPGTSTAYQLSRLAPRLKGLLLESRAIAHPGGSSYGESRMYRQMYSDPYYATMQAQALALWQELEQDAGVKLLREQGLLFYGDTDTGECVWGVEWGMGGWRLSWIACCVCHIPSTAMSSSQQTQSVLCDLIGQLHISRHEAHPVSLLLLLLSSAQGRRWRAV
jgi:hypothetical protein